MRSVKQSTACVPVECPGRKGLIVDAEGVTIDGMANQSVVLSCHIELPFFGGSEKSYTSVPRASLRKSFL